MFAGVIVVLSILLLAGTSLTTSCVCVDACVYILPCLFQPMETQVMNCVTGVEIIYRVLLETVSITIQLLLKEKHNSYYLWDEPIIMYCFFFNLKATRSLGVENPR